MSFLLTVHVFITLALIGVILLQRSEGGGGLVSSGTSNTMFTARGAANLLTRVTAVLAVLFIGNCILMTALTSKHIRHSSTLLDAPAEPLTQTTPSSPSASK